MTDAAIVPPGPSMNRVRGMKKFFGLKEWNLKKDLGLHFLRACSASEGRESPEPAVARGSVLTEAMGEVGLGGGSASADEVVDEVVIEEGSASAEVLVEVLVEAAGGEVGEVGAGGGTLGADAAAGVETVTARAMEREPAKDNTAVPFIDRRPLCRLRGTIGFV
ncbi:hypothetical protein ABZU75_06665 [Streptosporangium sp. NPDC005286]|uniref:hypothetical protein n=1 Tax=Streptosporangium sp. NPDC005286 TaxID=3154463 RepID=UPI0033A1D932